MNGFPPVRTAFFDTCGKALSQLQVVAILAFTACSGSAGVDREVLAPPNYYASSSAVCNLLKRADLEAIMGRAYPGGFGGFNPDTLAMPGIDTCIYESPGSQASKVYLGVVYAYADQIYRQIYEILRTQVARVKGIGTDAVWYPGLSQLWVLAKGKMLVLQAIPDVEPNDLLLKRLKRLAAIAIERLR